MAADRVNKGFVSSVIAPRNTYSTVGGLRDITTDCDPSSSVLDSNE